jgi:hypothetical protein
MSNVVHEASIEDCQDRKPIMYEKPEPRDGRHFRRPEMRAMMADIIDVVMINMYKKAEMRNVKNEITDATMLKHGVRGWRQEPLRKGVQEDRDEGWDTQDHRQGQVRQERDPEQRDDQEQSGRLDHRSEAVLLSV